MPDDMELDEDDRNEGLMYEEEYNKKLLNLYNRFVESNSEKIFKEKDEIFSKEYEDVSEEIDQAKRKFMMQQMHNRDIK
ncbi:hypothetical protein CG475_022295 (plasmid) [Bacillus cytotoxicus]|uniref:hypothetical protein n=1 Tax=Bacillus cytotoxicus TaxID=580165 RepID=UPI000B97921B|nr:hypothetical protein [Bacillus cytotoxicus]AWC67296.1 hypothetical protein CG475_022295 [Bacillus cytotoxicus]